MFNTSEKREGTKRVRKDEKIALEETLGPVKKGLSDQVENHPSWSVVFIETLDRKIIRGKEFKKSESYSD